MSRHYQVHVLLNRDELDQLEAFAREPGRTVDACHEWLLSRGFTLSRTATLNWKRSFDVEDKFKASNEVARTLLEAARQKGAVAISDAAALQLSQMVFEQLLRMQQSVDVDTKALWACSMALKNVISGKRDIEKLQEELAGRQKQAIEEAQKLAGAGGDGQAVIGKVRQILGIEDHPQSSALEIPKSSGGTGHG